MKVTSESRIRRFSGKLAAVLLAAALMLTMLPLSGLMANAASAELIADDGGTTQPSWSRAWYGNGVTYKNYGTTAAGSHTYQFTVQQDGMYDFYVWQYYGGNYWNSMPFKINYDEGSVLLNATLHSASANGEWAKISTAAFPMREGATYTAVAGGEGYNTFPRTKLGSDAVPTEAGVLFDAVKLVRVGDIGGGSTEPSIPGEVPNPESYLNTTDSLYRVFAPGVINPGEGTIEMTLQIDKDMKEFGNDWDFIFRSTPDQEGPGNNLLCAFIPPPTTRPAGDTYEQPLNFFIKNGENSANGVFATADRQALNYTKGEKFNLAFSWKMGTGGYAAIYKNGVQISRENAAVNAVIEKFLSYQLLFSRTAPFAISNLEISTRALTPSELESSPAGSFTAGDDTALLADITFGQQAQQQYYQTPYHTENGYSVVKPIFDIGSSTFYAGETVTYPVLLLNRGAETAPYTVTVSGQNQYGGGSFSVSEQYNIPADGLYHAAELILPVTAVGYYSLEAAILSPNGATTAYDSAVTISPAADSAPDGTYASHYGQHTGVEYDTGAFKKLNATTTRAWETGTVFLWCNVEPEDNQFQWDVADDYVDGAMHNGMDVYAVLGYPADWASARPPVSEHTTPPGYSEYEYRAGRHVSTDIKGLGDGHLWRDYVYNVMKRYAGQVKYYEIVNEANFHSGFLPAAIAATKEEYFLMQKIAYETAQQVKQEYFAEHGAELELYVTSSGFTSVSGSSGDRQMVLDALNAENSQYFDIFTIHGYDGTGFIQDVLDAYAAAKERNPGLQLWQGEYMAFTSDSISWRLNATIQNYMEFVAAGTDKYFNMGVPNGNVFLTRYTQSPTPVWQTMAVFQQQLRKADAYIGKYNGFDGADALPTRDYLRRTDGSYLSVFTAEESYDLLLDNPETVVSACDAYGVPVSLAGNTLKKLNNLFVVSTAPLEISQVAGAGEIRLINNGGLEKVSGDTLAGPAGLTPVGWTMGWQTGAYGENAYLVKGSPLQNVEPFEGEYAIEFDSTTAPQNRVYMNQLVHIAAPGTYTLSAYIKRVEGTDVQPELNFYDGEDHQLAPVALTEEYAYYSRTVQVTKEDDYYINIGILSGAGVIRMDNIALTPIPDDVSLTIDSSDAAGIEIQGNTWNSRDNEKASKGNFMLNNTKNSTDRIIYTPAIPKDGVYRVEMFTHGTGSCTNVPVEIQGAGGTVSGVRVNQVYADKMPAWETLGEFSFSAGTSGKISIWFGDADGLYILADAVRLTRVGDLPGANGT